MGPSKKVERETGVEKNDAIEISTEKKPAKRGRSQQNGVGLLIFHFTVGSVRSGVLKSGRALHSAIAVSR